MLERTVGCLETGSARRLFPASHQPLRSRRMLHSAFWNHGAIEIEDFPVWSELVRVPILGADEQNGSHNHSIFPASVGHFLDFLYPSGAVKLMRQYSLWKFGTKDARKARSRFGALGQRLYSSATADMPTTVIESAFDLHAQEDRATTPATQTSLFLAMRTKPNPTNPVLKYFNCLHSTKDFDKVWQHFTTIDLKDRVSFLSPLLTYLSNSDRQVDEERAASVFEEIGNTADYEEYRSLIKIYLNRGMVQNAMKHYLKGLEKLTLPAGADILLAFTLEAGEFQLTCDVWTTFVRFRKKYSLLSYNIWLPSDKLLDLPDRIIQLAEFVKTEADKPSGLERTLDSSILVGYLATRALRAMSDSKRPNPIKFDTLLEILKQWDADSSERYEPIITKLANSGHAELTLKCYRKYRQRNTKKISRPILNEVLKIACEHDSVPDMQEVLDDWFRYYSKPPGHVYRMCMTAFAKQGAVDTVNSLFEQYLLRRGRKSIEDVDDFTPLLDVYARRGDLSKVLKIFNEIEGKYRLQPSITCWNILIKAYGKVLDMDGAFVQFDRLLASSITPNSYTYGSLMGICAAHGDLDQIMELYQLVESRGVAKTVPMIDCIVLGHIQENRLLQAEKICNDVLAMNLNGSLTRMWNYLLTAYAMRRDLENTNRILSRMYESGIEYDGATYSALMQVLAMTKQPDRAYKILKNLTHKAGVKVTSFHYAVVMGGYIANGELHKVFHLQSRMLRKNIAHTTSTRLMTMKARVMKDQLSFESSSRKEQSIMVERYFRDACLAPGGREMVDNMRKGVGFEPVDTAYLSSYFSYLIFVLGQRKDVYRATELYEQYIEILPEQRRDEESLRILSAMMVVNLGNNDYENVQQLWDLAFQQAKRLGQPYQAQESSEGRKIIPLHEQDLTTHLSIQLRSLARQRKIDQLSVTKTEVEKAGFVLDVKNWNIYIQCLARSNRYKQAFNLCERMLMDGWSGWARVRWREPGRNRLPLKFRNLRRNKRPILLRPFHHTFLQLGKAYIDLQDEAVESEHAREIQEYVERNCTRTIHALNTMERVDEELEREILRGY